MAIKSYTGRKTNHSWLMAVIISLILSSCYSVRIVSRDGVPEPDPMNTSGNFYKGKKVNVLDTTISLKLYEGDFHMIERCAGGGFYSLEYRVTFGGVLLSAVTLGKKRKVKIKYVCLKQDN